jgi:hypothetical protein
MASRWYRYPKNSSNPCTVGRYLFRSTQMVLAEVQTIAVPGRAFRFRRPWASYEVLKTFGERMVHRSMHSDVRESPRRLSWCSTTASRFGGSEINDFDPGGVFRDLFPKGPDQAPMEADSNSPGGDYAVKMRAPRSIRPWRATPALLRTSIASPLSEPRRRWRGARGLRPSRRRRSRIAGRCA